MKRVILFSFCLGALNLLSADVPIIFLHGNKAEAVSIDTVWENGEIKEFKGGLLTWYPLDSTGSLDYPTAMTKIIGYQGYDWGLKNDGSPAEKLNIESERTDPKMFYGISCWTGFTRIVEIQLEPLSPHLWGLFSWNNKGNLYLGYYFAPKWMATLEIGVLCIKMWIRPIENLRFISIGPFKSTIFTSVSFGYLQNDRMKIGVDIWFTKIKNWRPGGIETGGFLTFKIFGKEIVDGINWDASLTARLGLGKDTYIVYYEEPPTWFNYDVLEIYLNTAFDFLKRR